MTTSVIVIDGCRTCRFPYSTDGCTTQRCLTPDAVVKTRDARVALVTRVKRWTLEENSRARWKGTVARQPSFIRAPRRFASFNRAVRFRYRWTRYSWSIAWDILFAIMYYPSDTRNDNQIYFGLYYNNCNVNTLWVLYHCKYFSRFLIISFRKTHTQKRSFYIFYLLFLVASLAASTTRICTL